MIRISEFTEQTDSGLRAALKSLRTESGGHLRGLILDLRNDPGGLLDQAIAVSNDFLGSGGIVSTRGRHADDDQTWSAKPSNDVSGNLPVVVLTNNGTASAAEIVAGALQDDRRALVLGTQSFGKGSVQTLFPLPGYGAIRLTTARYFTPSGRSIQGVGITPNVEVEETRNPPPHFAPEHEADLRHILTTPDGARSRFRHRRPPICPPWRSRYRSCRRRTGPQFDADQAGDGFPVAAGAGAGPGDGGGEQGGVSLRPGIFAYASR